jgi:hypothetical protein
MKIRRDRIMGIINNECIIATTWNHDAIKEIKKWIHGLPIEKQKLFAFTTSLVNAKITVFMGPDGSKKGWQDADEGESLRNELIGIIKKFDYEDGSNPFYWVEVGYGEYGQKVLKGNCKNMYDYRPYYED